MDVVLTPQEYLIIHSWSLNVFARFTVTDNSDLSAWRSLRDRYNITEMLKQDYQTPLGVCVGTFHVSTGFDYRLIRSTPVETKQQDYLDVLEQQTNFKGE